MYFIGDVHGKFSALREVCHLVPPNSTILQVGDMGIGFGERVRPDLPQNLHFIRGNHDNPKACAERPEYLGDYGLWKGIFFMGGAFSIDKNYRVEGVSWWPGEELSEDALRKATDLYLQVKPSVVVTHDCPTVARPRPYRGDSRTSLTLDRMFSHHQPVLWIYGHHHVHKSQEILGTRFQCLAELEVFELPSPMGV